jgi:predicted RNA-binding Zn ribbon-like protein
MSHMADARNSELRIVGGHPVLDLINTVAPRVPAGPDRLEYLSQPADLVVWAGRAEIVDAGEASAIGAAWEASPLTAAQALRAAVDIREAAYAVLAPRLAPAGFPAANPGDALDRLMLRWAAAAARSELVLDGPAGPAARLVVGTVPGLLIPDRLAHAAVELLCQVDPGLGQLRVCPIADGGCGWLFFDRSRNGTRRWCAMADCGTQAKVRRLTERRRALRASTV